MTLYRLLFGFKISKSLLSLIAILVAFVIIFISVWLWFDYKMKQLEAEEKQPAFKERPNF